MKLIKQITILSLILIFLISSSGLFVVKHYCSHSKKTIIYFSQNHTHKHKEASHETCSCSHEEETCSTKTIDVEDSCCNDNVYYFKISEPYTFSVLNIDFSTITFDISFKIPSQGILKSLDFKRNIQNIKSPPLILEVKTLLSKLCILRL